MEHGGTKERCDVHYALLCVPARNMTIISFSPPNAKAQLGKSQDGCVAKVPERLSIFSATSNKQHPIRNEKWPNYNSTSSSSRALLARTENEGAVYG